MPTAPGLWNARLAEKYSLLEKPIGRKSEADSRGAEGRRATAKRSREGMGKGDDERAVGMRRQRDNATEEPN